MGSPDYRRRKDKPSAAFPAEAPLARAPDSAQHVQGGGGGCRRPRGGLVPPPPPCSDEASPGRLPTTRSGPGLSYTLATLRGCHLLSIFSFSVQLLTLWGKGLCLVIL